MTKEDLLEIIAQYLNDRDDIAVASAAIDVEDAIAVETQGGTGYIVTVEQP